MSNETEIVEEGGLFGFVPAAPMTFDPHAAARAQARARMEAAEKADIERRIATLPTREELAVRAMDIFTSPFPADTKLKAMQFYAQLMGFMDKEGKGAKKGDADSGPKIMAVPMMADNDQWEKVATKYSKQLERIANAGG